jgi:hypothetical protein
MYMYPHAIITPEYKHRFENIVTEFRDAISKSKQTVKKKVRRKGDVLSSRIALELHRMNDRIHFRLNVCGTTEMRNRPTIIVCCPELVTPMLKIELEKEHLRRQYTEGLTSGLAFDLIYQEYLCPPLTLLWCSVTVANDFGEEATWAEARQGSTLTMCGSRVFPVQTESTAPSSFTTLACIVEIKSELYGLTTAHGIQIAHDSSPQKSVYQAWQDELDEFETVTDDDDSDCDCHSVSEVSHFSTPRSPDVSGPTTTASPSTTFGGARIDVEISTAILPDLGDDLPGKADCDWAIFPIKREDQQLPNAYATSDRNTGRRFITDVAREHPLEERIVHILTSKTVITGRLQTGLVSVGSLSGRGPQYGSSLQMVRRLS